MLLDLAAAAIAFLLATFAFTALTAALISRRYPRIAPLVKTSFGALHVVARGPLDAPRGAALLIHGASGNFGDLDEALAAPLVSAGFRVFSVDRPGHGWSERARGANPTRPETQASMIRQAMAVLGVRQALVVAHSLGGPIGLAMALEQPDFTKALALLTPVSHPWPGGVAFYYGLAAHRWLGPLFRWTLVIPIGLASLRGAVAAVFAPCPVPPDFSERTRVPLVLRPGQFKANAEDVVDCFAEVSRLSPRYGTIQIPVTIVIGEGDRIVYNDFHAGGCMRQIAGARLVSLDVGHSPHHSATEATVQAILALDQRASAPLTMARA